MPRVVERLEAVVSSWIHRETYDVIAGRECTITVEHYVMQDRRGPWCAKVWTTPGTVLARELAENADMHLWPRYYFDEKRARLECEAWLRANEQWVGDTATFRCGACSREALKPPGVDLCGLELCAECVSDVVLMDRMRRGLRT